MSCDVRGVGASCPYSDLETNLRSHQGLGLLLVALTMPGAQDPVQAQDEKVVEQRDTFGAPPKGNPWAMQIERLVAAVDEESKGK
jgi:hypothetical protein